MDEDRSIGVTEARFGLTVLICLLVAIGYLVLMRLGGGSSDSTVELRPDNVTPPIAQNDETPVDPDQPKVLVIVPEGTSANLISQRQGRPAPRQGDLIDGKSYPVLPAESIETERR
jgi:hypothetical protein